MTWGPKVTLPPTVTPAELAEAMEAAKATRHMRRIGLLGFAGLCLLGLQQCASAGAAIREAVKECPALPTVRRSG